jgi:hypothetical protein
MFRYVSSALREYRDGTIDAAECTTLLDSPPVGRTPNPNRICIIIAWANVIGPIMAAYMGFVWIPLPVPPQCVTTAPSTDNDRAEARLLCHAVADGLAD